MKITILWGTLEGILALVLLVFVVVQPSFGKEPINGTWNQSKLARLENMSPEALLQLWDQASSNGKRTMIVDALLEQRSASLPILRNIVNTGSQKQKMLACSLLAEMKDIGAVRPLLAALGDVDKTVRVRAALTLGKIGDSRAIVPLRNILKENFLSKPLAKSVLVSLGRLGSTQRGI